MVSMSLNEICKEINDIHQSADRLLALIFCTKDEIKKNSTGNNSELLFDLIVDLADDLSDSLTALNGKVNCNEK